MKVNQFSVFVGIFILLSACATTKNPPEVAPEASITPDTSDPTLPVAILFTSDVPVSDVPLPLRLLIPVDENMDVVVRDQLADIEVEPLYERGSVESVSDKMEGHPGTLYWGGKDTYSFYVGGVLSAEYKPGEGLRIQEVKGDDSGIVCQFGEKDADVQKSSACSQLMLTLDAELDD